MWTIQDEIWGMDLIFAARTLRETREALERGGQFKSQSAIHSLDRALDEADRIKRLLAKEKAA